MSVASGSASLFTRVSTVSKLDLQTDALELRSADTCMPKERILDETLNLLVGIPNRISWELSDTVYLITCRKCGKYYVGETDPSEPGSMNIHFL